KRKSIVTHWFHPRGIHHFPILFIPFERVKKNIRIFGCRVIYLCFSLKNKCSQNLPSTVRRWRQSLRQQRAFYIDESSTAASLLRWRTFHDSKPSKAASLKGREPSTERAFDILRKELQREKFDPNMKPKSRCTTVNCIKKSKFSIELLNN
ncbi:hypothetical protein V8G54_001084, partial [Vigna mungo]